MNDYHTAYTDLLIREIKATPDEYLPNLLGIIRIFRESIFLKSAEDSFRKGWKEAMSGNTIPIDELWIDIDGD